MAAAGMGPRVTHVIEQLRLGGPLFALTGASRAWGAQGPRHRILSLLPADPRAIEHAANAGMSVLSAPALDTIKAELADADLVQLHFWNSPLIHEFMGARLAPMRVLAWCHVNGFHAPHVLPESLLQFADIVAVTSESSLRLPVFRGANPGKIAFAFAGADFSRIERTGPLSHEGINVGYVGLVDFVKLHPAFVRMCAAVNVPSVRFTVCGSGDSRQALEAEARQLGVFDRFTFSEHVDNVGSVLSGLDVLGHPLCTQTYAAAELALQEAMFAGIPPVVFGHGGMDTLVTPMRNGLVASSETGYVEAIETLCRNPELRKRLGANAASDARRLFGGERTVAGLQPLYEELLRQPKRAERSTEEPNAQPIRGARAFVRSLDSIGDIDWLASLEAAGDAACDAERRIATAGPAFRNVLLQYRFRYSDDAHLRLWTGLVFADQGRNALAASEFKASIELGLDHARVRHYFSMAAPSTLPRLHP